MIQVDPNMGGILRTKFTFGCEKKTNFYNFPLTEDISESQFDILYDKENKKFSIQDHKKSSGVFLEVKDKQVIEDDLIFSFCSYLFKIKNPTNNKNCLSLSFISKGVKKPKL